MPLPPEMYTMLVTLAQSDVPETQVWPAMPYRESLKSFYDERALVAFSAEHVPRDQTPAILVRYVALQAEIASLEGTFAQTWHLPCADALLLLPRDATPAESAVVDEAAMPTGGNPLLSTYIRTP